MPSLVLAIDKEEALYYANWIDTIQDNNLTLSKAFINENPSKALVYISQAIANTDNNFLKAKCYIQKGIIYNYSYLNKRDSALENLIAARDIYLANDNKKKLTEKLRGSFENIYVKKIVKEITQNLEPRYTSQNYSAQPGDTYENIIKKLEISNEEKKIILDTILNEK